MKAAMARAKPLVAPITVSGLSTPLAQRADEGRGEGRAAGAGGAAGAARDVRAADAAAGLGGRGRVLERRRADELGRDGRLRRRRPGVGLRPRSSRATGGARCCCRTRTSSGSSTTRWRSGSSASTYKLARVRPRPRHDQLATASARSPGRTGALPHTVPVQRDRARRGQRTGSARSTRTRPTRPRSTCPSGGSWTSFVAPLAVVAGRGGGARQHARRGSPARCARGSRSRELEQAAALLQPLRLASPPARREDGSVTNAVLSGAANDLGGALATIDAYTGKPPQRHRRQRAAEGPPRRRPGVHPRRHAPARACGPGQRVRARVSLQRVRGDRADPHLHAADPRPTARAAPSALRFVGQDADAGRGRLHDDHPRRRGRGDEGGDPGPRDARRARRRSISATAALRRRDAARRPQPAPRRSATTTSGSPARPRRPSASRR